jgi:alkylhydroperoxidase/carboxymuconolactone decarboxylase family protein YurZ
MDKDESTKELNCIALVLVSQKEDMLLMHETHLLANPDIKIYASEVILMSSKVL